MGIACSLLSGKEQILSNSSKKIDIVIFWDLPPIIRFRVLKEGKLLYEKNHITLHRIKVQTLKSYLDIQRMIRRHNSMYDRERISKIISDIDRYFQDLNKLDINNLEDLSEKKNVYAVSMILFSILNRSIDLADEMVIANNLGMPSTYREIFQLLAKNKYIDHTLMEKMSNLVFYRNLLPHEYFDMTENDVFDVLKRIDIVRQFVNIVKAAVEEDW